MIHFTCVSTLFENIKFSFLVQFEVTKKIPELINQRMWHKNCLNFDLTGRNSLIGACFKMVQVLLDILKHTIVAHINGAKMLKRSKCPWG